MSEMTGEGNSSSEGEIHLAFPAASYLDCLSLSSWIGVFFSLF